MPLVATNPYCDLCLCQVSVRDDKATSVVSADPYVKGLNAKRVKLQKKKSYAIFNSSVSNEEASEDLLEDIVSDSEELKNKFMLGNI